MSDGVLSTGKGMIRTRAEFTDYQLHVEFATPTEVKGNSQERGNSGVYLNGKFEIQVLDSYQNITYPDGQAAAMYGQFPPLVNASRPPGEWQSYDIVFTLAALQARRHARRRRRSSPSCTTASSCTTRRRSGDRRSTSGSIRTRRTTRRGRSRCRITAIRCATATSGSGRSRKTAGETIADCGLRRTPECGLRTTRPDEHQPPPFSRGCRSAGVCTRLDQDRRRRRR